ncbi:hypothetical protein FRC15_008540 [Serendipita sp. 397]|nr:hypothetical protein FRC15_008540 [Serendipita sp. 397]KAG8803095.1 hypothetical protein FRC16_007215 [Serendipita sp. 398]
MNENERGDQSEGGSGSGSGVGWHARALTRMQNDSKSAAALSSFDPGANDLVFLLCVQSKGAGDGFACALLCNDDTTTLTAAGAGEVNEENVNRDNKPGEAQSHHHLRHVVAVDAFGRVLELSKEDYEVFEREIRDVKELPKLQEFMGQWRVKRPITCLPFYKVDIFPGRRKSSSSSSSSKRVEEGEEREDKVTATVYGWNANTDELERETVGRTRLPGSLQRLIGLGMEGRDGYNRTIERDEEVIGKVMALGGLQ